MVAVLEHVERAVDARALAVPEREHAVVLGAREQADLLRAPDRGGGEVLVDAGLEDDVALLEELARPPQRLVEPAERRAAIAGDEAGGVQPGRAVALALQHRQAHQRLDAGHQHPPALERVAVVEAHLCQGHGSLRLTYLLQGGTGERAGASRFKRRCR